MGMLDYVMRGTRAKLVAGEPVGWLERSARKSYIRAVVMSAPPWVGRTALRLIQLRARQLSELSGVEYHIDHIIPINHPRVCGLTVPWNLQIIPARVNLAKGNACAELDDQLSLF